MESNVDCLEKALPLESRAAQFYIELTLNHPRTPKFNNMPSKIQKLFYSKILMTVLASLGPGNLELIAKAFEVSQDGNMHLHCLLHSTVEIKHFPLAAVADIVKAYQTHLQKKYAQYKIGHMYPKLYRYKGIGICCQYRFATETERIAEWETYLKKYNI